MISNLRWWWWRRSRDVFRCYIAWAYGAGVSAYYVPKVGCRYPQPVITVRRLARPEAYTVRFADGHERVLGPKGVVWVRL